MSSKRCILFFTPARFEVHTQWVWKFNGIPFITLLKIPFKFLYFAERPVLAKVHTLQIEQPLSAVPSM